VIGLDTNILVRYIVRDDRVQTELATQLIETNCTREQPGFITLLVLIELVWVLSRGYAYPKSTVVIVLTKLFTTAELMIEHVELARRALESFIAGSADFPDYLIGLVNSSHGCGTTYTFDKRASRSKHHSLLE
jgi:predicted nucleic-acid-binding protein